MNFQEKAFYQTRWEWAAAKLGINPNHDIDIFIEEETLNYEDEVQVDCSHISEQLQDIEVIEHRPVNEEETQAEEEVLDWLTEDWDLDYPVRNSNFWSATYSESTCVKSAHTFEEVVEYIEDWDVTCPVKQFQARIAVTETHSSPDKVQPKTVPMLPVTSSATKRMIIVTSDPLPEPMKKVVTAPTKKPQPLRIAAMPAVNPNYANRSVSRVNNFAQFLNPAKKTKSWGLTDIAAYNALNKHHFLFKEGRKPMSQLFGMSSSSYVEVLDVNTMQPIRYNPVNTRGSFSYDSSI